jgi:UDP-glucuronate 4-epimerase
MRILISGGAGFIGFHLVTRLLSEGHSVTVIDNFNGFYDPQLKRRNIRDLQASGAVSVQELDILDRDGLRTAYRQCRPEAVVHLAAWAGVRPSLEKPELYSRVNVTGTVNMLDFAKEFEAERFMFASSSSVYGGNEKVPFSEDDAVDHPISPYAATKKAGELLCYTYSHNFGMHISCLRLFTVYGPRQRPEMAIHKFAQGIRTGKPIPVFGDGQSRRDYTYVEDVVSGILCALRVNPAYGIYNLGESSTISLLDLIRLIEAALGKKAELQFLPEQPGDMSITYADISRARREIGYAPTTPIESGIRKFADWFLKSVRD